jgi:hypothetical protein
MKVTVSRLIEVLNNVRNEVGGDCEVNLFNGGDYSNPATAEANCGASEIIDVMIIGAKSFLSTKSRSTNDEDGVKVWIKYE